ncbi:hypothetical protein X797_007447 [Metarhizium robertsii]|uniref:Uncharacterized protein n=1 Tax=Metarhizium robertsii TaxID=568076 RepID=A0A014NCD2_9HYPO|nr:hypothetical protein X797_007447 [Metarhizium robertsii]
MLRCLKQQQTRSRIRTKTRANTKGYSSTCTPPSLPCQATPYAILCARPVPAPPVSYARPPCSTNRGEELNGILFYFIIK